jgi:hypothetical protein
MARCVAKGNVISVEGRRELPQDFVAQRPETDARVVFLTGSNNLCFLPESQRKSYDFFDSYRKNYHSFHLLANYGHLDVFIGKNAMNDVFPIIINELDKP